MLRPNTLSLLAFAGLLAACPAEPTEMETVSTGGETGGTTSDGGSSGSSSGTSPDDTSTGGTSPGGTDDETAGPDTEGGSADCSYAGTPWVFVDELDMPRQRGVGSDDNTCNPVTTETTAVDVLLVVPDHVELGPTASVRVLLFEYDPSAADASADCVGGTCAPIEGDDLSLTFDVPNDLPELGYYVSVDMDDGNGCILHEVDFVTFSPAQGTLMVPMTASDCI